MERFKALEKEMKMKAFSKEGLLHASKLDPAEKARREMIDWVNTSIEELSRQTEATEAELESLTVGKKKKSGAERATELEELNDRRSWHVGRLEIVQRMLENGTLGTEAVEGIQEDVKYFLEENSVSCLASERGLLDGGVCSVEWCLRYVRTWAVGKDTGLWADIGAVQCFLARRDGQCACPLTCKTQH